jgi:hypothetical protein
MGKWLAEANISLAIGGWAHHYFGVNLRYRHIRGKGIFAPGVYAKLPLGFGFEENDEDDDTDWSDLFD